MNNKCHQHSKLIRGSSIHEVMKACIVKCLPLQQWFPTGVPRHYCLFIDVLLYRRAQIVIFNPAGVPPNFFIVWRVPWTKKVENPNPKDPFYLTKEALLSKNHGIVINVSVKFAIHSIKTFSRSTAILWYDNISIKSI